jgi:tRNA dimethylallyltransferase
VALHGQLQEIDALAAAAIQPANGRRIVRALEVITLTGRPYTANLPSRHYLLPDVVQIGLDTDRPTLDARIERRVSDMWDAGLVDEVRHLADHGLRQGVTASRALGYRQVLQFLDGEVSEAEARGLTITGTRKFARRQDSWFRKDTRITWVGSADPDVLEKAYAVSSAVEAGAATPRA